MQAPRNKGRRAICPQCKRTRFIPHITKPYCTPSCRRAAEREQEGRHAMTTQADMVLVYDETADEVCEVTRAEAAAGMARFARSLGPGTAACGVWERRAVVMARGRMSRHD